MRFSRISPILAEDGDFYAERLSPTADFAFEEGLTRPYFFAGELESRKQGYWVMEKHECGNGYSSHWLAVDCKAINEKLKCAPAFVSVGADGYSTVGADHDTIAVGMRKTQVSAHMHQGAWI